jgi:hypothetical protein
MIPSEKPNPNPIEETKKRIVDFANARPFFQQIPVITDERGDVETQVQVALNKLGLSTVFEMNSGAVKYPGVGCYSIDLVPTFTITERVLLNRNEKAANFTGKIATDVLCELYAIFHPMQAGGSPLYLTGHSVENNTGGVIIYQLTGKLSAGWKETT